jgi:CTP synthase
LARIHFVNSEGLSDDNVAQRLEGMVGVVICPGFGLRGTEGKIVAAHYCRTHNIPTLGICLGMQMMVVEFARHVLGYADASSSEFSVTSSHPVISMMEKQKTVTQMGGTMRLGAYECRLTEDSRSWHAYGRQTSVRERHRHRYEFNSQYLADFERHGMLCAGVNPDADLVEIVEVPAHRWYVGTQFHPEYSSTVLHPHPLFMDFIGEVKRL